MGSKTQTAVWVTFVLLVASAMATLGGCDIGDFVRVPTPIQIQQDEGLPKSMTYNNSKEEYRLWLAKSQSTGAQWKGKLEDADYIVGTLSQLTLQQLNEAGPTLAGLPVVGPSSTVLLGLAGYFFGKKGQAKEKERSYNAGLEKREKLTPTA